MTHKRKVDAEPQAQPGCERDNPDALKVIAVLYVAMTREGWEKGPTIGEAQQEAHDWFYRTFGHGSSEAASQALERIGHEPLDKTAALR